MSLIPSEREEISDGVYKYSISDNATFICGDGDSRGCSYTKYENTTTWHVNGIPPDNQILMNVEVINNKTTIRFNVLTLDNNGTTVQCHISCPLCGMRMSMNATIVVEGKLINRKLLKVGWLVASGESSILCPDVFYGALI